jgi:outer membrane cobalamin receptor
MLLWHIPGSPGRQQISLSFHLQEACDRDQKRWMSVVTRQVKVAFDGETYSVPIQVTLIIKGTRYNVSRYNRYP